MASSCGIWGDVVSMLGNGISETMDTDSSISCSGCAGEISNSWLDESNSETLVARIRCDFSCSASMSMSAKTSPTSRCMQALNPKEVIDGTSLADLGGILLITNQHPSAIWKRTMLILFGCPSQAITRHVLTNSCLFAPTALDSIGRDSAYASHPEL